MKFSTLAIAATAIAAGVEGFSAVRPTSVRQVSTSEMLQLQEAVMFFPVLQYQLIKCLIGEDDGHMMCLLLFWSSFYPIMHCRIDRRIVANAQL